jgi:hypothetical protein
MQNLTVLKQVVHTEPLGFKGLENLWRYELLKEVTMKITVLIINYFEH